MRFSSSSFNFSFQLGKQNSKSLLPKIEANKFPKEFPEAYVEAGRAWPGVLGDVVAARGQQRDICALLV